MSVLLLNFKPTDLVPLDTTIISFLNSQNEQIGKYDNDAKEIHSLRTECMNPEIHENSLYRLLRYYGQLISLSGKLPFEENAVRINWRWYSSFEKGRKKPVSSFSISMEKANILFNIGCMYNQLGHSVLNRSNIDTIKKAAFYYQVLIEFNLYGVECCRGF
jgi:programmed cell death 6-interacting protein